MIQRYCNQRVSFLCQLKASKFLDSKMQHSPVQRSLNSWRLVDIQGRGVGLTVEQLGDVVHHGTLGNRQLSHC